MKKYLLITLALSTLNLQAYNNPFELQKNLEKIDHDQDVLLSVLQEMEGNRDEFTEDGNDIMAVKVKEKRLEPLQIIVPAISKPTTETSNTSNDALMKRLRENLENNENIVQDENITKQKNQKAQENLEVLREKQVKQEEEKIEELRIAKIEKEKRELQRKEEERREVAAYETERLAKKKEKLLQEAQANLEAKIRKEALVQKRIKEESDKTRIADINLTKEAMIEFLEEDKAYLEAVKEMQ